LLKVVLNTTFPVPSNVECEYVLVEIWKIPYPIYDPII
jgi:hypothetical protein